MWGKPSQPRPGQPTVRRESSEGDRLPTNMLVGIDQLFIEHVLQRNSSSLALSLLGETDKKTDGYRKLC